MKKHILYGLSLLIALQATAAMAKEALPVEELAPLVATAVASNPEVKASEARWEMFLNKIPQAKALEDPMLMLRLDDALVRSPFSTGGKDPATAKVVGISQQLPFRGKRALREEVARHEAESYQWAAEERKIELSRMVKEAYYRIYVTDKELEVVEKNLKLLADFAVIAESRYAVGQGVQQDIYKAKVEKSKLIDQKITLEQRRKSLEATLNYLLFRPADTPVGKVQEFEIPKLALSPDALQRAAQDKRPQLKALSALVRKGDASRRLAEKEYYPDFNLSFEYMMREEAMDDPGYDMYSVGVTFNLPTQKERRRSQVAEAASETRMAQHDLSALTSSIRASIIDSLAQLERRRKQVELYQRGLIPQASQALESAIISYRVNKVDFLTVLDGRINLFNYEKDLFESKAEYMIKLAELEAVIGADPAGAI